MKKRYLFLVVALLVCSAVSSFFIAQHSSSDSLMTGFELGFQQGIETGQLYDTVLLKSTTGSISSDELNEINRLRDEYYKNPSIETSSVWHNKMAETVSSKK